MEFEGEYGVTYGSERRRLRENTAGTGWADRSVVERGVPCVVILCAFLLAERAAAAQELDLNPTRPTIANSAAIQSRGVLQVETGYDAYPRAVPGDMQTISANLSYAALARLRLDFAWSPFALQQEDASVVKGVSTIQAGGKVELWKENYSKPAPGVAIQYEAELPTASRSDLQNYGQQIIVLLNHHYGKDGILDVIVNGSLVQENCQSQSGCRYGGQQSFALSYHVQKTTRIYGEVFGQNNSESNTPPGTYVFGGFYHAFSDAFGINGGVRFGVSQDSAPIGTTVGLVFGRRLQGTTKRDGSAGVYHGVSAR